ncbi:hypothetical protein [Alteraurantiacibacter buctensis]|uniref:Uncharacterized protein n=1 Tax=Alteraurantiacibacter buctensis TaxID=1503981 RepID=A0A844Z478_9SPHN|nr:hypothetical protein [Alteraurantiacibacter buctensis]MXO73484.1 hypothetical protein [Alteraurantiacibacter buctensis]
MKQFFRDISPRRAVKDFLEVWRGENRHRWLVLGVAVALTGSLLALFLPEGGRADPRPPEITWVTTFAESRTAADIIASNCANQRLKDALQARIEEREELRKDLYAALGRATFVDVDEMEAEARAEEERAAVEAAAARPDNLPEMATMTVEEYCAQATQGAAG